MTTKSISLTESQFETLLKLVHLGALTVNGHRDEPISEYEIVEKYIYEQAKQFDCGHLVEEHDLDIFPSDELEESPELQQLVEEHSVAAYCDVLLRGLTIKAVTERYSEEEFTAMTPEAQAKIMNEIEDEIAAKIAAEDPAVLTESISV